MQNKERIIKIKTALTEKLNPETLDVIDDSHLHVGHAGAKSGKGHFTVKIKSASFQDKNLVQSHRMVYEALGELMQTDIHALSIHILRD